jgi:transposase
MDKLFELEQKAREQGLSRQARHAQRLEKAQPLLEQIKSLVEAARSGALPKSVLAKACNYTLTLWRRLTRFLEYPELELSNNWAENAIRPVALGSLHLLCSHAPRSDPLSKSLAFRRRKNQSL